MTRIAALILPAALAAGVMPLFGQRASPSPARPSSAGTALRPTTVQDLLRYRRIEPGVRISPDGTQVAYVVREPDVERDVNEYVLYVVPVPGASTTAARPGPGRGREVLRTQGVGFQFEVVSFQWLEDSRGLLVLHKPANESRPLVSRVDLATGRSTVVYQSDLYVTAFAGSASGDRLVVAGATSVPNPLARFATTRGVLMTPNDNLYDPRGEFEYQRHIVYPKGAWAPELRVVEVGGPSVTVGRFAASGIAMSPDGRAVLLSAAAEDAGVALSAAASGAARAASSASEDGSAVVVLLTVPVRLSEPSVPRAGSRMLVSWPVRLAFANPGASVEGWSDDGTAYLIGQASGEPALAAVDVASGAVSPVPEPARRSMPYQQSRRVVTFDQRASRIVIAYPNGSVTILRRVAAASGGAAWTEAQRVQHTTGTLRNTEEFVSVSRRHLVAKTQHTMVAPELFAMDLATAAKTTLTDLNPELRRQRLGRVETIEWSDRGGTYFGNIVYPVDYQPGTRYPCAILAKGWDRGSFIYEDQDGYRAGNFPAQALAGSNILVFMLAYGRGEADMDVPQGSIVHRNFVGAREQLAKRGLVDPAKCGVMGFSSTAFEVTFLVSHPGPDPQWAAAISVDGFQTNNYATVFMGQPARAVRGNIDWRNFGFGPGPEGRTIDEKLPQFLARSSAWNAQHVRTPLLLRRHGNSPIGFAEMYSALWSRKKPVEYWWMVDGAHTLTRPSEREAAMQQAVDWFRFWLQGYERPRVPEDPERYVRWRALREQHHRNEQQLRRGGTVPGGPYQLKE